MKHEYCLAKIALDHPEMVEEIMALGVTSQTAETEFLKELLSSAERLSEDGVRLNRKVMIQFIDYIDQDDKEEFQDVLTEVDMSGGSPENLKAHIEQVTKSYYERQVRIAFNRGFKSLNDQGEPDKAIAEFEDYIKGLQAGRFMENGSLARRIQEHKAYLERLPGEEDQGSKMFGLKSLDEVRGPDPGTGELIIIAAGPKVGKSSLFNNIALSYAQRGEPLFFGSAEMDERKTTERLLAAASELSSRIVGSKLALENKVVKKAFEKGQAKLKNKDNLFIDYSDLSVDYVRKVVYTYYYKYDVKTYMFDRIGLFAEATGRNEFGGRRTVTRALRKLANELPDLKIILGSQIVNDSAKSRNTRPAPHHVFGGTGGQADCTQLYLIYRPYHIDPSNEKFQFGPWAGSAVKATPRYTFAEIYCPLNSNGPANGTALVVLDSHRQVFEDLGKTKFVDNLFDFSEELERIEAGENTFDSFIPPHMDEEGDEPEKDTPISSILGAKGQGKNLF